MTDTPIYDQLRLELSSRRAVADSPPKPRASAKPAAKSVAAEPERHPVSVWTLVNANKKA